MSMVGRSQFVGFLTGALNRPELRFSEVLVPWIMIVGALGFLVAWLVVAIMERTGLSRYVWHLPLFFVGLVILLSSLIGMMCSP
jgi:predicted naringenin-chalcone synthase